MTSLNVAEAKRHLSDLLGRVAQGGETILITRRGKPMAKLTPVDDPTEPQPLAEVEGWLDDDHPFFAAIDDIVDKRSMPRVLREASLRPDE